MNPASEPKLAAPGAGIPFRRKLLFTYIVRPLVAARSDWLENARGFAAITDKILAELQGLSVEQLTTRRLVPKQPGLEDSSRYWSIAMALEHLVIVGRQMEEVIGALSSEKRLVQKVDTAKVKPLGQKASQDVIEEFKAWAVGAEQRVLDVSRSQTSRAQLAHPWFGSFNSLQWQWLMTQHHATHLRQIRSIRQQLV